MQLIELFLPLYDNVGQVFPRSAFDAVRDELAHVFGGVTAFVRSPAIGVWKDDDGDVRRDDVVLFEVTTETLDRAWWRGYQRELRRRFDQEEILVRASVVDRL